MKGLRHSRLTCVVIPHDRRILNSPAPYPDNISRDCTDLLSRLMEKVPEDRLGANGADEIKQHPWFKVSLPCNVPHASTSILSLPPSVLSCLQSIDWSAVLRKEVAPPFKPYITDELDVGNFSEEFTALAPIDSPAVPPAKHADIFRVSGLSFLMAAPNPSPPFPPQGYSFIAAPVLFTDNLFAALDNNGISRCSALKVPTSESRWPTATDLWLSPSELLLPPALQSGR